MFAKVFEQIFDSSIAEDWQVRHVFEDLLKLAKKSGPDWVVDMTPESIARRANMPLEIVAKALSRLSQPDPKSRSKEAEGRRIKLLDEHRDWGWRIVNYQKYKEIATAEMLRMAEAERKREYRNRMSRTCPGQERDMSVSVSVSASDGKGSEEGKPKREPHSFQKPTIEAMKLHAAKIGLPDKEAEAAFNYYESNGWHVGRQKMVSWTHALTNWKKNYDERRQVRGRGAARAADDWLSRQTGNF